MRLTEDLLLDRVLASSADAPGFDVFEFIVRVCVYFFLVRVTRSVVIAAAEPPPSLAVCDKPECVRCHRYSATLAEAHSRWTHADAARLPVAADISPRVAAALRAGEPASFDVLAAEPRPPLIAPATLALPASLLQQLADTATAEFATVLASASADDDVDKLMRDNGLQPQDGRWSVLSLRNQGSWVAANCARFPATARILQSAQQLNDTVFGNAFYSLIAPGTVIAPHRGPTDTRLRLQLPVQLPDAAAEVCEMAVGGAATVRWRRGEWVCFDDSQTHSVVFRRHTTHHHQQQHQSLAEWRVLFIVDVFHPALSAAEVRALRFLFAPSA